MQTESRAALPASSLVLLPTSDPTCAHLSNTGSHGTATLAPATSQCWGQALNAVMGALRRQFVGGRNGQSFGALTMRILATLPTKGRDLRLDLFRGVANWGIFLDH